MLHGVVVHCRHIVYVRHGEGDDVVVVRVVDVDTSNLDLTSVEKELAGLWERKTNMNKNKNDFILFYCTLRNDFCAVYKINKMKGREKRPDQLTNLLRLSLMLATKN